MKCPNCSTKVTWQDKPKDDIYGDKYLCRKCNSLLVSKYEIADNSWFIFVEIIVVYVLMGIVTAIFFGNALSDQMIFDIEALEVVHFVLTAIALVFVHVKLNVLKLA